MNKLSTLGTITVGAILLSLTFALAMKDRSASIKVDDEAGKTVYHEINGEKGEFVLRDDDVNLHAKWRGDYEINDSGTDIISLDDTFAIISKENGVIRKAVFEEDGDEIERAYYIDGEEQDAGDETDDAMAELLLTFLRTSGLHADDRVEKLHASGGVEAVFSEIDELRGDHALSRYVMALTEVTDLSDDELLTLVEKIKTIESDHDLSRSLQSVLEHQTVSPSLTSALIAAAKGIDSDHDLRKLVKAFAERPLNDEALTMALSLLERIEGDHDLRVAAEALLENASMDTSGATRIVTVASREIESDHDLRLILAQSAGNLSANEEFMGAWLSGFQALSSSHDQRLSIETAAETGNLSEEEWLSLIEAIGEIDSTHDQRRSLEVIAENMNRTEKLMAAYRAVAAGIDSSSDRKRALDAIGDDAD